MHFAFLALSDIDPGRIARALDFESRGDMAALCVRAHLMRASRGKRYLNGCY